MILKPCGWLSVCHVCWSNTDISICVFFLILGVDVLKGQDNGPVLITAIVLAVFDSCCIWFISFQCTPPYHVIRKLFYSQHHKPDLFVNQVFLPFGVYSCALWWMVLCLICFLAFISLVISGIVFFPPTFYPCPCVPWSCYVLTSRQKTLTWPCWPTFPWLCLTPLSAGGYPFMHLQPFLMWFSSVPHLFHISPN